MQGLKWRQGSSLPIYVEMSSLTRQLSPTWTKYLQSLYGQRQSPKVIEKKKFKFFSSTNLEDPGPTLDPLPLDERLNAVEGPGVRVQDDLGQGHQHQAQVN